MAKARKSAQRAPAGAGQASPQPLKPDAASRERTPSKAEAPPPQSRPAAAPQETGVAFWVCLAAFGLALLSAALMLNMPLRYDEAYTLMNYAGRPVRDIRADFSLPNNHIGFTVLLHGWMQFFHLTNIFSCSLPGLRSVSFVALLGGSAALFALFVRRFRLPWPAALCLAGLLLQFRCGYSASPGALRAYPSSMAALAGFLVAAFPLGGGRTLPPWRASLAALLLFVFSYLVPSNLWFSAAVGGGLIAGAAWHAWSGRKADSGTPWWKELLTCPVLAQALVIVVGAGLAARIAYDPAWKQIVAGGAPPKSLLAALTLVPSRMVNHALGASASFPQLFVPGLGGALLVFSLVYVASRSERSALARGTFALGIVPTFLFLLPAGWSSDVAFERNYAPLVPLGILCVATAVVLGRDFLDAKFGRQSVLAVCAGLSILASAAAWQSDRAIVRQFDGDALFARLRTLLQSSPSAVALHSTANHWANLDHYTRREKLPNLAYFEQWPGPDPRLHPVYWIVETPANLRAIATHARLAPDWRTRVKLEQAIGDLKIYRFE